MTNEQQLKEIRKRLTSLQSRTNQSISDNLYIAHVGFLLSLEGSHESLNEASERWDDDYGRDPKAATITDLPRRYCSVHNREEFKYESLEHELHAAEACSREQIVQAITDIQEARESHVRWAAHLRAPNTVDCQGCIDHAAHVGDAKYHDEWIAKYDNVIAVLARTPFATTPSLNPARHYFCSCGGALTAEEYIEHYFEKGHDRGEPQLLASGAAEDIMDYFARSERWTDKPIDGVIQIIRSHCFPSGRESVSAERNTKHG